VQIDVGFLAERGIRRIGHKIRQWHTQLLGPHLGKFNRSSQSCCEKDIFYAATPSPLQAKHIGNYSLRKQPLVREPLTQPRFGRKRRNAFGEPAAPDLRPACHPKALPA
ncbi:MAG: hypothetical protein ACREMY_15960, partial [bacterium]